MSGFPAPSFRLPSPDVDHALPVARIRYFIHPESGAAWTTTDGSNDVGESGDGALVEEVDEATWWRYRREWGV